MGSIGFSEQIMKKKAFGALAAVLPLTLLFCACGTSAVTLSANWYKSGDGVNVGGKSEQLEYEVTFEKTDEKIDTVDYKNGTYVTQLNAEAVKLSDQKTEVLGYHLHSELSVSVTYTVGNDSQTFTDSVVSDVYFKTVSSHLQPIRSKKSVHTTSPVAVRPDTLDEAYEVYDYVYSVEYNDALSKAEIKYSSFLPETNTIEKSVSVRNRSAFFDNEQLLFVLRGMELDTSAALTTIDPLGFQSRNVKILSPKAVGHTQAFTMNGTEIPASEEAPVKARSVVLMYDGTYSGQPQKLVYAANTAQEKGGENVYRNALLSMEVPILKGLGTLKYKLVNAEFND